MEPVDDLQLLQEELMRLRAENVTLALMLAKQEEQDAATGGKRYTVAQLRQLVASVENEVLRKLGLA